MAAQFKVILALTVSFAITSVALAGVENVKYRSISSEKIFQTNTTCNVAGADAGPIKAVTLIEVQSESTYESSLVLKFSDDKTQKIGVQKFESGELDGVLGAPKYESWKSNSQNYEVILSINNFYKRSRYGKYPGELVLAGVNGKHFEIECHETLDKQLN